MPKPEKSIKTFKSDVPVKHIGIDKIQLGGECVDESIVNDTRHPTFCGEALNIPGGHKINEHLDLGNLRKKSVCKKFFI